VPRSLIFSFHVCGLDFNRAAPQLAAGRAKRGRSTRTTIFLIDGFVASPPEPLRVSEFQTHQCTQGLCWPRLSRPSSPSSAAFPPSFEQRICAVGLCRMPAADHCDARCKRRSAKREFAGRSLARQGRAWPYAARPCRRRSAQHRHERRAPYYHVHLQPIDLCGNRQQARSRRPPLLRGRARAALSLPAAIALRVPKPPDARNGLLPICCRRPRP
jgi:hypothetical protein